MDLFVRLDRNSFSSLHVQLESQIREAIQRGRLSGGLELPSTRALAEQLGVARGVVVEGYAQLQAEGYLKVRRRGKTFVAHFATPGRGEIQASSSDANSVIHDFHPGLPDLDSFPRTPWARALRNAIKDLPGPALAYGDLRGAAVLREGLAAHLARARGVVAEPGRLVMAQGFTQGLALGCEALRTLGVRSLAVEDPCLPIHRVIVQEAGLNAVPIPVDEQGIRTDELEHHAAEAVLATPAHQFPMGAVLAPERRARLIDWARRHDVFIVEDDYDAEYRYDRDPIGSLQGLAPDRVIYGGQRKQDAGARPEARLVPCARGDSRTVLGAQGLDRWPVSAAGATHACRVHRKRRVPPPPASNAPLLSRSPGRDDRCSKRVPSRRTSGGNRRRPARRYAPAQRNRRLPPGW